MSFSEIQTASDRKIVCDAACAAQTEQTYLDEQAAARQLQLQNHFITVIQNWCNETNTASGVATIQELDLNINDLITSSVLDSWEVELTAKGYIVTRNGSSFRLQLI